MQQWTESDEPPTTDAPEPPPWWQDPWLMAALIWGSALVIALTTSGS